MQQKLDEPLLYRFGDYVLDTERLELKVHSELVSIEPQVFTLLTYLIDNRNRVVSKDELIDAVWEGRIVSNATLISRINSARRAVGDNGKDQNVIRTIARRGFRFVAPLDCDSAEAPKTVDAVEMPVAKQTEPLPSIIVLPFANVGDDAEHEHLSSGITEDIITALSRIRWLFVISPRSAFTFSPSPADLPSVTRELSVRYVLQGSLRVSSNRVRITARLVDGTSDQTIWAERFDGELVEIFDLQDEITSSIISSLVPELSLAETQRARRKRVENLNAWDHYLRALNQMHKLGPEAHHLAKAELKKSIDADPTFAAAHAGLAWCFVLDAILGWADSGRAAIDRALDCGRTAVALDEDDPRASCALAAVYSWTSHQKKAAAAAQRAIELDPNMPEAHGMLGYALGFEGKGDDAIAPLERALRGSPRDHIQWLWHQGIANAHFAEERYEDAIVWAKKAAERRPNWIFGYAIAASSFGLLEKREEAAASMERILAFHPNYSLTRVRQNPMWTADAIKERFFDGLIKANVPD